MSKKDKEVKVNNIEWDTTSTATLYSKETAYVSIEPIVSARNPKMNKILNEIGKLHDLKNADYATEKNVYSNFENAAVSAGTDVDTVFKVMIGIKLARLNALKSKDKEPNFESINDTLKDLATYACIYASYFLED